VTLELWKKTLLTSEVVVCLARRVELNLLPLLTGFFVFLIYFLI
jgi:hypothetical protein